MAFYRQHLSILLGCIFLLAPSLWSNEQEPSPQTAIPELPPVEPVAPINAQKEASSVIINTEKTITEPAFYADALTGGFSRYFNALDMTGYFRTRFNYFRNPHLRTYYPGGGGTTGVGGTSNFPPNLSAFDHSDTDPNPNQNNYSANMRARINPTINISELTRVKTTLDIFDNLVLGSTPNYGRSRASMMSMSQNAPPSALALKRAWGEANFPIGELRFGRMPMNWGLGILYNSGDSITSDYGDQIDGIMFTTRFFDHFVTPAYSIAYTGPTGRGGGHFWNADNNITRQLRNQAGSQYALDSSDLAHVFSLSFLKRDSDFITEKKIAENSAIFNYGLFTSYRTQEMDSFVTNAKAGDKFVKRDGHVGMGSWWTAFSYKTFHIEAEFAGIWGKYRIGEKPHDPLALGTGETIEDRDLWLLQGGVALESKYGFLDDRLQVGLDAGIASAQSGPGFGIREEGNLKPVAGDSDGQKLPSTAGYKSNFTFNPAYNVDLLLYREVLGGITGTYYFKPHLSYFFSRNFGLRGDAISAFAIRKSNTAGNSNLLGVELDASAFLRTEGGFYFSLAYGVLFPLKGLDHSRDRLQVAHQTFGHAQIAQTVQLYLGLMF